MGHSLEAVASRLTCAMLPRAYETEAVLSIRFYSNRGLAEWLQGGGIHAVCCV